LVIITLCIDDVHREQKDKDEDDSQTHHVDRVQCFFNSADEDADDSVTDAGDSHDSRTATQSVISISNSTKSHKTQTIMTPSDD